ncbi:MAG: hypothetical protein HW398_130, partial [Acidobacteria bacterium]|nr:hypothetical protein [Acidobacteriota bacterium]
MILAYPKRLQLAGAVAAILWASSVGWGQSPAQAPAGEKKPSVYDRIWKFAEWYNNEENPVVQNVLFSGRFQYEYATLEAGQLSHHEWNVRRLRLGAKSKLFRSFTLHGEVELNPQERDPFYLRFTDAYLM